MQKTIMLTVGDIVTIVLGVVILALGITLILVHPTTRISRSELRQRLWEEYMFLWFLLVHFWRKIAGLALIIFSIWTLSQ